MKINIKREQRSEDWENKEMNLFQVRKVTEDIYKNKWEKKWRLSREYVKNLLTDKWLKSFIISEVMDDSSDEEVILEDLYFDPTKFVEVDTTREPMNIVFIGHVDSGKSTTCGRILVSSNSIDKKEIKKFLQDAKEYKRES